MKARSNCWHEAPALVGKKEGQGKASLAKQDVEIAGKTRRCRSNERMKRAKMCKGKEKDREQEFISTGKSYGAAGSYYREGRDDADLQQARGCQGRRAPLV